MKIKLPTFLIALAFSVCPSTEMRGAAVSSQPEQEKQNEGDLAVACFHGLHAPQNYYEALKHAQGSHDSAGQVIEAMCIGRGKGTNQDVRNSLEILAPLILKGDPMANAAAAIIMGEGRPLDQAIPPAIATEFRDELAAIPAFDPAVRTKHTLSALEGLRPRLKTDAVACLISGELIGWGVGIPKNEKRAEELFRQSWELGCSDAANQLANIFRLREPVRQNLPEAIRWLRKGADAGNIMSKQNLVSFDSTLSPEEKRTLMTEAAEAGCPDAMLWLGSELWCGSLFPHDLATAGMWLEKAADFGSKDGVAQLGRMLGDGAGTEEDRLRGTKLLRQAVARGSEMAANYLCDPFFRGAPGIPANPGVAYLLSVVASNGGYPNAWAARGLALENGDGVPKNLKAARKCLETGAKQGSAWATFCLGSFIGRGVDGPPDLKLAFHYYLAAAEMGEARAAMRMTGVALLLGNGVGKDEAAGIAWLRKAITHHDMTAADLLGLVYEKGTGVEPDAHEAIKLYRQSAEGGDGGGMYHLALAMTNGSGMTPDPEAAFPLLMKADKLGIRQASFLISQAYEKGNGVPINPAEAWKWLLKSAESDDPQGCYWLGEGYRTGRVGPPSPDKAFQCYTKAAGLHHPVATNNLGCCYQFGQGVPADPDRAFLLYTQAAEMGERMAFINLAICHQRGIGTPVDLEKANEYRLKAAAMPKK